MLARSPSRTVVLLALVSLTACTPAPGSLAWRIELEDASSLGRVAVVDARILRGGCDGVEVFGLALRRGDVMPPVPPVLGPGVWGFSAAAHDASCARFAASCEEITLPGATLVVNALASVTPSQVCTGARCDEGSCRSADEDGDGVGVCVDGEAPGACDCDDDDPEVRPGAEDPCDDADDQDCDGADDACDADCDGFPEGEAGTVDGRDCDDRSIDVHPNASPRDLWGLADGDRLARGCEAMPTPEPATDGCVLGAGGAPEGDRVDQDCNGLVDDGMGCSDPSDRDRDGSRACGPVPTRGCDPNDCDPGIAPTRAEICGNAIDEDADGTASPCDAMDSDGDGQRATSAGGPDCDDSDPRTFAGAPDDCRTPEAESCSTPISCADGGGDADGDGYVARPSDGRGDCNDRDPDTRPFADEDPCDGDDDDCDGIVDEVVRAPDASPGAFDGCVRVGGVSVPIDYDVTRASAEHCGGCGVATSATEDCCAGAPTAVDRPSSCGACGFDCGPRTACARTGTDDGGDVFACACARDASGDWADCNGSLAGSSGGDGCETDLSTDEAHCGGCGRACGVNQVCTGGTCTCVGSFLDCDGLDATGCERDGRVDPNHCGRCGNRCEFVSATPRCVMGACRIDSCDPDFADCDSSSSNGCEARLTLLPNCGMCGQRCLGVLNATESCAAMRCDYTSCDGGFGDCDGLRSNGCETSTATSLSACGSCSTNCNVTVLNAAGRACMMGTCNYVSCNTGSGDCDLDRANGCETALTSVMNCGACGNTCGPGESCNAAGDCACGMTTAPSGRACGAGSNCVGSTCL